jgi:hypothetical protein
MNAIVQQALEDSVLQACTPEQPFACVSMVSIAQDCHSCSSTDRLHLPSATLQAVRNIEDDVDTRLQALDNLDADDIERLRQRRLDQMKQAATRKQVRDGHSDALEQLTFGVQLSVTLL